LPRDGSAGCLELVFQFLVFSPESLPLRFRAPEILAQLLILATQPLDLCDLWRQRIRLTARHTPVMPDSRRTYKRKSQRLGVSVCRDRREARVSPVLTR